MNPDKVANALRYEIERKTGERGELSALAKNAEVDLGTLWRFVGNPGRDFRLGSAEKVAVALGLDLGLTKYIRQTEEASSALEEMIKQPGEQIKAIGTKSREASYLKAIEAAVHRGVSYERLLSGGDITHPMHEHLDRLILSAEENRHHNIDIRHAPRDYYPFMTITDKDCVLAFPSKANDQFTALRFAGQSATRRFIDYFSKVFGAYENFHYQIRDRSQVKQLCEECGGPKALFYKMADQWRAEAKQSSERTSPATHPSYQRIMGMGITALRFIFEELKNDRPDDWFCALRAITGENPVRPNSEGNYDAMAEAWIRWGTEAGYVKHKLPTHPTSESDYSKP